MPPTSPRLSLALEHLSQAIEHLQLALNAANEEKHERHYKCITDGKISALIDIAGWTARLLDVRVAAAVLRQEIPVGSARAGVRVPDTGSDVEPKRDVGATLERSSGSSETPQGVPAA
jgi:hypothetical protein